jgi:hypothetical protein
MKKSLFWLVVILAVIAVAAYGEWSHLINLMLPADSRPARIEFPVDKITPQQFETVAAELQQQYRHQFKHIDIFRDSSVLAYEGPSTCLRCHGQITYSHATTGDTVTTPLWDNLLTSAHYRFYTEKHANVWGFNGELADDFKMGKINRPCPKPGSFAMTAWADIVVLENGDTLSEGCGQCHIGGQYQAPLGDMMPGYRPLAEEKDAVDCLICHAQAYDMNQKEVIVDPNGRKRWGQDRSMMAAMSVTRTTAQTCLRCHQHNMGGDMYVDTLDPSYFQSLTNTGYDRPRVLHPGSKRGTPYSPSWDVHAAGGVNCTECHTTEGHYIARGTHTTTLMANDLPDVEVSCTNCHDREPHAENEELADYLNNHTEMVACQACHIPSLHPDNATMRDFSKPIFEEHPGIWVYTDIEKETEPGKAMKYVWWNGDATFLGNAIGDNPHGGTGYRFYNPPHVWPEFAGFDYDTWYDKIMRPISQQRPSKLYPLKVYNGKQHIDLQNMGPFGGMFVPYNLPVYYTSGSPDKAAQAEMAKPMMAMMYGWMFKVYMMDRFMRYMAVDSWNTGVYEDVKALRQVEPRWIPSDASMEISHAIRRQGALTCANCHSPVGVIDWKMLGYSDDDVASLSSNPLE